jgi:urease subunit alpha
MVRNAALPHIEVDPQTFQVRADGVLLHVDPVSRVPLARKYLLR